MTEDEKKQLEEWGLKDWEEESEEYHKAVEQLKKTYPPNLVDEWLKDARSTGGDKDTFNSIMVRHIKEYDENKRA